MSDKQTADVTDTVNQIMEQAQVFASAWSLVGGMFDSGDAIDDANDAKDELRDIVTRAILALRPVRQPATPEPVLWWLDGTSVVEFDGAEYTSGPEWTPLYDHPAPSVPDVDFELQELREIERAMDDFADCGETDVVDTLLLRAVQAGFLECTHFHVANRGALQEAIDAAMLAAK